MAATPVRRQRRGTVGVLSLLLVATLCLVVVPISVDAQCTISGYTCRTAEVTLTLDASGNLAADVYGDQLVSGTPTSNCGSFAVYYSGVALSTCVFFLIFFYFFVFLFVRFLFSPPLLFLLFVCTGGVDCNSVGTVSSIDLTLVDDVGTTETCPIVPVSVVDTTAPAAVCVYAIGWSGGFVYGKLALIAPCMELTRELRCD